MSNGLARRAKVLTESQIRNLLRFVETETQYPERNRVIVLLSFKAGLRAKEIAGLTWGMLTDAQGVLRDFIALENLATKGNSGRIIPLHQQLAQALHALMEREQKLGRVSPDGYVVRFKQNSDESLMRSQSVQFLFRTWYRELGYSQASSHSGRRTFITTSARKIFEVGGSLCDVQQLAGHSSVQVTQLYVDRDANAQKRLIALL